MDLSKSFEFFNPVDVTGKCHIIGCGSVGSTIAELLARLGVTSFVLYDFDTVEPHNLVNQMFVRSDVGQAKVDATKRIITDINPEAEQTIELHRDGYVNQMLNGYVFLCVDNIDLRREICTKNRMNRAIKVLFDFRTRLKDMQNYAAEWANLRQVDNLIKTMAFSHEEAHAATPVTACGRELGVAPTVRIGCSYGIANFINYINGNPLKTMILTDAFGFDTEAY